MKSEEFTRAQRDLLEAARAAHRCLAPIVKPGMKVMVGGQIRAAAFILHRLEVAIAAFTEDDPELVAIVYDESKFGEAGGMFAKPITTKDIAADAIVIRRDHKGTVHMDIESHSGTWPNERPGSGKFKVRHICKPCNGKGGWPHRRGDPRRLAHSGDDRRVPIGSIRRRCSLSSHPVDAASG